MQYLRDRIGTGRSSSSIGRRRLRAAGLGLLVLFTIWGFGRAWHGGFAPVEFVVGLVAGTVAAVVTLRGRPPR